MRNSKFRSNLKQQKLVKDENNGRKKDVVPRHEKEKCVRVCVCVCEREREGERENNINR